MDDQELEEMKFDVSVMQRDVRRQPDTVNGLYAHEKKGFIPMLLTIQICTQIIKIEELEREIKALKLRLEKY